MSDLAIEAIAVVLISAGVAAIGTVAIELMSRYLKKRKMNE
jgi:hypothetical protein